MGKLIAAMSVLFGLASAASAQVIYAPVQSQYRVGNACFYYGGSNPRVFELAQRQMAWANDRTVPLQSTWREGRPGSDYLHRGLINEPAQYTYSDVAPHMNAIVFGYTSVDARNDAYANVPRFFRMADLQAAAVRAPDGVGVVIPAQAPGTIDIHLTHRTAPSTAPATQPKPVMIIPKKLLDPGQMTKAE